MLKLIKSAKPIKKIAKTERKVLIWVWGGGRPMRDRDLIMWPKGHREALKKIIWKGDRQIDRQINWHCDSMKESAYGPIQKTFFFRGDWGGENVNHVLSNTNVGNWLWKVGATFLCMFMDSSLSKLWVVSHPFSNDKGEEGSHRAIFMFYLCKFNQS